VEPGDVQTLAERISTLADHPDLCDQMGMNSLEIVKQKLSVQTYVDRLIGVYEGLTIDCT
jgi:glycosyltransferase involved in cell wall biosynthesis